MKEKTAKPLKIQERYFRFLVFFVQYNKDSHVGQDFNILPFALTFAQKSSCILSHSLLHSIYEHLFGKE